MPLSVFSRRRPAPADPDLSPAQRGGLPRHFEAVAEALAAQRDPAPACAVAGGTLAADGASLNEALSALRATYASLGLGEPTFAAAEALSLAWSEETLAFIGEISCEDPLTGLASAAHLRARIAEVYRAARVGNVPVRRSHALLVVDLALRSARGPADPFDQALRVAGAAEVVRDGFPGGETLARVGRDKVVVLTRREPGLGPAVTALRSTLHEAGVAPEARLWIEGLPPDAAGAVKVLGGLALL